MGKIRAARNAGLPRLYFGFRLCYNNRTRMSALKSLMLLAILGVVFLPACGNNPYRPEPGRSVGYAALTEDPRTLDPAQASDTNSAEILSQIYDSLYQNAYLARPYRVEPALAAGYPEKRFFYEAVEEKGAVRRVERMEYVFKLKDDIFFQDDPCFPGGKGRRVTAGDVVYAIKRLADPAVQSTGYWLVEGKIKGMDAFFKEAAATGKADYSRDIEGLAAPDERTLRITLTEPFPAFIYVMSMPYTAPVAHEAVEYYNAPGRAGFTRHPVGTGAYRLKSWERQHRIILERNPTYRKDYYPSTGAPGDREKGLLVDAGKAMPFIDEVWYTIIATPQPLWLLFLQGYLDASGIPQEQFDRVITQKLDLSEDFVRKGISLEVGSGLDVYYIAFNMRDPVLGRNIALRRALSLSYDTDLYNQIFLNGRAINAQGPLPPGIFGYDPRLVNPYKAHDVERARRLMVEAGFPGGIDARTGKQLELTYDISSDSPAARERASFDMRCFEQLGIKVKLQVNTFSQYLERTIKGTFQMTFSGWVADYPDPENFLQLLYGPNRPPSPNHSAFSDPEYDRLYQQMKVMEDTPERLAVIHKMVEIAIEKCPWIFIVHTPSYVLRHGWYKNGKSHAIPGNYRKYLRIDGEEREAYWRAEDKPNYRAALYGLVLLCMLAAPAAVLKYRGRRR